MSSVSLTHLEKRSSARMESYCSCQQRWQEQHLSSLPLDVGRQWGDDSPAVCYLVMRVIVSVCWYFCCQHGRHHQKEQLCHLMTGY